jgi:hypothetical protein
MVVSTSRPADASASNSIAVSPSRSSLTKITSAFWRPTRRSASINELVSEPTSRWLTNDILSAWSTSIGSSTVTMWTALVALIWSIMAAMVVVRPEPAGPVTISRPLSSLASRSTVGSRFRVASVGAPGTTRRIAIDSEPR